MGAEQRGQGEAIARSMFEMANLKVPILSIVIGEGSSGGALAICIADKIFMLENAVYSILSPEGFASILYKDASKCQEVAEKMKITASDLQELKIIDELIEEHKIETEKGFEKVSLLLKRKIKEQLLESRYEKYRKIGG